MFSNIYVYNFYWQKLQFSCLKKTSIAFALIHQFMWIQYTSDLQKYLCNHEQTHLILSSYLATIHLTDFAEVVEVHFNVSLLCISHNYNWMHKVLSQCTYAPIYYKSRCSYWFMCASECEQHFKLHCSTTNSHTFHPETMQT